MILIISEKSDKHADRVESILLKNTAEYSRLNLDIDSLKSTQVKFEDNTFKIEGPDCNFSTDKIEAVWNRSTRIDRFIEKFSPQDEDNLICNEIWNKTLEKLFSLLEATKWLNFYHDFYAETQFRQYAISKNIGLKWPSYICTNDINYLNSFFENKKEPILKLMDQSCQIKSLGDCIEKCGDMFGSENMNNLTGNNCLVAVPSFQVRCTVVGNDYFVGKRKVNTDCESPNIEACHPNYALIQPPISIRMKAIQIMTELNLTHGVFDFIVTENNEWFFDALNPLGKYEWVEDINGTDISSSIAKWLMINN